MKVITQYYYCHADTETVFGHYNYYRIIHNIEKNYATRQDIGQTNAFSLKIKSCVIRYSKHFQTL